MELFLDIFKKYSSLDVTGHNYADADSIISTWLMGKVLKSVGVDPILQYPLVGDESDADKKFIENLCEYLGIPLYDFVSERENVPIVYVDCDGFLYNVKNTVAIIDHHKKLGYYDVSAPTWRKASSATAFLIYDLFKGSVSWTNEDVKAVAAAIILDTQYLNNKRKLVPNEVKEMEKLGIDMNSFCKELMEMFIPFPDFYEINQHVKHESLKSVYVGSRNAPIIYKTMYVEMYFPGYGVDDAPIDEIMEALDKGRKMDESVAFFFYDYDKKESLLIAKMCLPEREPMTIVQKFDSIVSRGDGLKEFLETRFKTLSLEVLGESIEEAEAHLIANGLCSENFAPMWLQAVLRDKGIQCKFVARHNDTPNYLQFPWGFVKYSQEQKKYEIIKKEGE